jgi:hypothetical protein
VAVLRHIRANYQNKTATVLKEAANNYLEVATPTGNEEILPSVRQRGVGAIGKKRKKLAVEMSVPGGFGMAGKSGGKTCDFCKCPGHNKALCPLADKIGKRLTKKIWGLLLNVPQLDAVIDYAMIDPVVPKDALGVQVIGCSTVGASLMFKGNIVLRDMTIKQAQHCWLKKETLDEWTHHGKSSAHFVFVPN